MVKQPLYLSMKEPKNRTLYAKKGDSGRIYEVYLTDAEEENGTLRVLRPDGVEVTSDAESTVSPTITDGMATFDSLEEAEVTELKIALSPKQDLHGYDHPWVGGAGKNKVPKGTDRTNNDITYTVQDDGRIKVTGTATATSFWGVQFTIPSGSYVLNGCPSGGGNSTYLIDVRTAVGGSGISGISGDSGNGSAFTLSAPLTAYLNIRIASGYTAPSGGLIFSPMIRLATETDATFAPYSNICPIYPSNGKNIVNIGGSVFDTQQNPTTALPLASYSLIKGFAFTGHVRPNNITSFSASGTTISFTTSVSDYGVGLIAEVEVGKTYTFSATHDGYVVFAYYDASGFFVINENKGTQGIYSTTVPSGAKYLIVLIRGATAGTSNISIDKPQLEQGAVATPYVPYQGINLYQVGKNLLNPNLHSGLLGTSVGSNDTTVTSSTRYGYTDKVDASKALKLSYKSKDITKFNWICVMRYVDGIATERLIQTTLASTSLEQLNISAVANSYIRVMCGSPSGVNIGTEAEAEIQVEYGNTATAYEPYVGTTYPLSLGQSVYGGTLDVVSGKLTVTHEIVDLGDLPWFAGSTDTSGYYRMTSGGTIVTNYVKKPTSSSGVADIICSAYKAQSSDASYLRNVGIAITTQGVVSIYDAIYNTASSATDFKTAMEGQKLVFELETPTEVDLTPTQISTLLGENNVWSDGEITELTFEYDGMLAELPEEATEQVGKCIADVAFTGASSMPFILHILDDVQEETP